MEPLATHADCREVSMIELFPFERAILDVEQFQIKWTVRPHFDAARDW